MIRALAGLCILTAALSAQARVFNINDESFAAYIRGTMGPKVLNTLNSESSGNDVRFDSEHDAHFSGEFGFLYASPAMNVRFGLEILKPSDIKDAIAKNSSEAELYSITSEIAVMIPKFALELNLYKWSDSRVYMSAGAGYANLAARNSYTMTAAGTSALGGLTDFYEDLRGGATALEGTVAYEHLLTDSTTFALEGGYRSLTFDDIRHNRDTNSFQGNVVKNDRARKMNGDPRTLNLSNWFVGLALRFWIQ